MKVTPERIVALCAIQIILTTFGFILYKRPYFWAISAVNFYKKKCEQNMVALDNVLIALKSLGGRSPIRGAATALAGIELHRQKCEEDFFASFTQHFYRQCSVSYCKPAFIR